MPYPALPVPSPERSLSAALAVPLMLLLAVGLTLAGLARTASQTSQADWLTVAQTLVGIAAGCAFLAWVRPQRAGLSPPHVMLSLGYGGMLLGLLVDIGSAGTVQLDAMCGQASSMGFLDALSLHVLYLPLMHAGMLAGGLLAIPTLRLMRPHCGRYLCSLLAQNLMCSGWMLVGMTAGALWAPHTRPLFGVSTLPGMLGGMFVGMTWGMAASVALYRAFFVWRDRRRA